MLTAEQLLATHKANVATLFDLGQKAFEGVEKVLELNLQVAKTTLDEVAEHTKSVLAVKDAQELLALQTSLMQPSAEKAAAYGRHLYDIASSTGSEVSKMAESQIADAQKKFASVVDNAVKNAPAGTENAVVLVKSAVAAANNNNNNNRRGPNPLTRNYESNGPDVKIRGSAQQIAEKYAALARDAMSSGDRVMAENYLQHAEHYNRIIAAAQAQMPIQHFQQNRHACARLGTDKSLKPDEWSGTDRDAMARPEHGEVDQTGRLALLLEHPQGAHQFVADRRRRDAKSDDVADTDRGAHGRDGLRRMSRPEEHVARKQRAVVRHHPLRRSLERLVLRHIDGVALTRQLVAGDVLVSELGVGEVPAIRRHLRPVSLHPCPPAARKQVRLAVAERPPTETRPGWRWPVSAG